MDELVIRARRDADGAFYRKTLSGGDGTPGQGLSCITADGELLVFRALHPSVGPTRAVLEEGLAAWRALPEARRKPKKFTEARGEPDPAAAPAPPKNGLVIRIHSRELDPDEKGGYRATPPREGSVNHGGLASLDHLWLKEEEWKSLLPEKPAVGARSAVPSAVLNRIVHFHLIDMTRAGLNRWYPEHVKKAEMFLTVEEASASLLRLRLEGEAALCDPAAVGEDGNAAEHGFEARLFGYLEYDSQRKAFKRFDVVAVGPYWGEACYAPGSRPGRNPLGIAFVLADGKHPADRTRPEAGHDMKEYFASP